MKKAVAGFISILTVVQISSAQVKFMDQEYAKQFCDLWNQTGELTEGLSKWSKNTGNKGYRIIRFYRQDCGGPEKAIEVHIAPKDGKAVCIYGGKATDQKADFLMFATDENWKSLAKGEFGFMGMGIMSKMTFEGSKWEAMQNMGPFKAFLLNLDKVQHTMECP
ncbi:MAG TPA: SCP-2 sterol transfer family protein [Persephonella sp.]|uniref:SCP-2 sterol transfer family protein n=1 Tax=Persephonella marina (strain DSM 14350 / EX-H1) TaxID=123214 RepID=C0QP60_PERMH|nr:MULTISPECIES: SCP2 sterol-binding domain-containing protein [Persephonella]ACO03688.1 SCP-2 sterol transfer family protein [Persephonella marina EX-H1]HCB69929.1 SCP-2 sterol transfer family protein [Persephonella sp.]